MIASSRKVHRFLLAVLLFGAPAFTMQVVLNSDALADVSYPITPYMVCFEQNSSWTCSEDVAHYLRGINQYCLEGLHSKTCTGYAVCPGENVTSPDPDWLPYWSQLKVDGVRIWYRSMKYYDPKTLRAKGFQGGSWSSNLKVEYYRRGTINHLYMVEYLAFNNSDITGAPLVRLEYPSTHASTPGEPLILASWKQAEVFGGSFGACTGFH